MTRNPFLARRGGTGSPWAVAALVVGFAAVHSLLASRAAKHAFARLAGEQARDGLYRIGYVAQSTAATVWAVQRFVRMPDRELYRAPRPLAVVLHAVQIGSLLLLATAVGATGLRRIAGWPQLTAWMRGEDVPPEIAAQGPPLARSGDRMDARGPFRRIRHPDNLPIITLFWSFPRMTVNRLTLAILSSIYAVLGSLHEDTRLRAAYGRAFEDYARQTPLFLPRRRAR
jgi:hypothetical protein